MSQLQNSRELDSAISQNCRTVGCSGLPGLSLALGLGPDPGNPSLAGRSKTLFFLLTPFCELDNSGSGGCLGTSGLSGWLVGWLPGWLSGWLAAWLPGWLAACLPSWLAGWLAAWLPACLFPWLDGWLTPLLILSEGVAGRLAGWLTSYFIA